MSGLNPDTLDDLLRQWRALNEWDRSDATMALRFKAETLEDRCGDPMFTQEAARLRLAARLLQAAGEKP